MENQALIENIQFQFSVAAQLLDYHLATLGQEEYMWRSPKSSFYIKEVKGKWMAEWPESESYTIGPPSIAWTLWHITYWWEMVFNHSFGDGQLVKEDVKVTDDVEEIRNHIQSLVQKWGQKLSQLTMKDFNSKAFSKFPFNNEVEFHKLASWLNLELMKNTAEFGCARFAYAAASKEE